MQAERVLEASTCRGCCQGHLRADFLVGGDKKHLLKLSIAALKSHQYAFKCFGITKEYQQQTVGVLDDREVLRYRHITIDAPTAQPTIPRVRPVEDLHLASKRALPGAAKGKSRGISGSALCLLTKTQTGLNLSEERVQLVTVKADRMDHGVDPDDRLPLFTKKYMIFMDWKQLRFLPQGILLSLPARGIGQGNSKGEPLSFGADHPIDGRRQSHAGQR